MSWELVVYLGQMTATVLFYALFLGAGVSGLIFVIAFLCWLYDRAKRELYD